MNVIHEDTNSMFGHSFFRAANCMVYHQLWNNTGGWAVPLPSKIQISYSNCHCLDDWWWLVCNILCYDKYVHTCIYMQCNTKHTQMKSSVQQPGQYMVMPSSTFYVAGMLTGNLAIKISSKQWQESYVCSSCHYIHVYYTSIHVYGTQSEGHGRTTWEQLMRSASWISTNPSPSWREKLTWQSSNSVLSNSANFGRTKLQPLCSTSNSITPTGLVEAHKMKC